jgi:hypothetical protein
VIIPLSIAYLPPSPSPKPTHQPAPWEDATMNLVSCVHTCLNVVSQSYGTIKRAGTTSLLPLPLFTILGPNSSMGRYDQYDDGTSLDGDDEVNPGRGNGNSAGVGVSRGRSRRLQRSYQTCRGVTVALPFFHSSNTLPLLMRFVVVSSISGRA